MLSSVLVTKCQGEDHEKDQNAPLGETLHATMVRAALEEGLAHHTPETLRELVRTGVYKGPESGTEKEETKVPKSLQQYGKTLDANRFRNRK